MCTSWHQNECTHETKKDELIQNMFYILDRLFALITGLHSLIELHVSPPTAHRRCLQPLV